MFEYLIYQVVAMKYKDGIMMAADTMVAYGSSLRFKVSPNLL